MPPAITRCTIGSLLEHIASPRDVRALDIRELPRLCSELRRAILASSAAVGGHVGPNLGVVELTVALHRVFEAPADRIIFDVSHQTYAHKALTGRAASFLDPARYEEVSGFSNPRESPYDLFSMGHTSTSISLACGLAGARDLADESYAVVAVIGDGALSGGLALEGLDNAADLRSGLIIVVNDNGQSIAENHGGLYRNLAELRATRGAASDNLFRSLGLDYRYLDTGNDVFALVEALSDLRGIDHPVVVHVRTVKGCGFAPAQADPESWHHAAPFSLDASQGAPDPHPYKPGSLCYADITGALLTRRIERSRDVVAISAATPYIMGFGPERRIAAGASYVDVGICEEHAVTFAAGLAIAGANPVFGVYGTFLQRAYDELWHDMCLNSAPATILIFGSSIFGNTAETHQGFFDIAMLGVLPNLRVLAPVCREEYEAMLDWSIDQRERPVAIRVPETGVISRPDLATDLAGGVRACDAAESPTLDEPTYRIVRAGRDVAVLALGTFFTRGEMLCDELASKHGIQATLVNPRFASELDRVCLDRLARDHRVIVTLEDGVREGGWGERVAAHLGPTGVRTRCYGASKRFIDRYDPDELIERCGMGVASMATDAVEMLRRAGGRP